VEHGVSGFFVGGEGIGFGFDDLLLGFGEVGLGLLELVILLGGIELDDDIAWGDEFAGVAERGDGHIAAANHGGGEHFGVAALEFAASGDGEGDAALFDAGGGELEGGGGSSGADDADGAPSEESDHGKDGEEKEEGAGLHFLASFFSGSAFWINQGDHGARANSSNGDFVGIARLDIDADGAVAAIFGEVDDGLAGMGEQGFGGDADGVGNALDDDIHAAVHAGAEAGVRLWDGSIGAEAADGGEFVGGFGEQRDLVNGSIEGEFGEGIDTDLDFLIGGNAAAIDLFDLGVHKKSAEIGHFGEDHTGVDVVADFEGLGIDPALGVVGIENEEAGDGGLEFHLGDAGLGEIDIGLGLIAQAGEGGDFGAIGGSVKIDGGLLDFEFLPGDAVIDLTGLALEAADDLLFGGFEAGALDGAVGVGEIGLVLFAGYFGLGEGLLEGGLGLAESGLLLHEGFLSAGGIEFDDGVALLDGGTGRGHPGDAEVGDHGCGDLYGSLGFEFSAAANEDQEIALAGGGGWEDGGG